MASIGISDSSKIRLISAKESEEDYGVKKGRIVKITGDNVTDEKVVKLMQEVATFLNMQHVGLSQINKAHDNLKKLCTTLGVEFILRDAN